MGVSTIPPFQRRSVLQQINFQSTIYWPESWLLHCWNWVMVGFNRPCWAKSQVVLWSWHWLHAHFNAVVSPSFLFSYVTWCLERREYHLCMRSNFQCKNMGAHKQFSFCVALLLWGACTHKIRREETFDWSEWFMALKFHGNLHAAAT